MNGLDVVVTGGTGALGRAALARLVAAGARCHVPCVEPRELADFPYRTHAQVRIAEAVDLADEAAVQRFFAGVPGLFASVHLAGGFAMAGIAEADAAHLESQLRVNLRTCFLCCAAAVHAMRAGGRGGRIVNVAARPALEPRLGAGMSAYAASKAAVAALTQSLAEELAPEGIWVNAVAPSILDTPANRAAMPKAEHTRWPKVEEVAEAIAFLVSPENRTVRGAVVPVYGRA
ncbi:MAG TPA: SDR family NAD(P)-dependent oxidoreductase [Burkholderiales bacterium]|nr:SDR family NAD(P)-dependent oxidoreductase [Burkholderiales bacterium]